MFPTTNKNRELRVGFTLIEILVVLAVFSLVMVAGTYIYLQMVQGYNRSQIRNEVRQNAERVMADIGSEIRKSAAVTFAETPSGSGVWTLTTYKDNLNTISAVYTWSGGGIYKSATVGTNNLLGSGVSAYVCSSCSLAAASCSPGLLVSQPNASGPQSVTISVQQTPGPTRSDFCGVVTLTDTFYPRNAP